MNVKPMRGIILVKPRFTKEEKMVSESGIILPETETDRISEGTVIDMGRPTLSKEGVELPYDVCLGDNILFRHYGKERVEVNGREHRLVTELDILCVLDRPEEE